MIDVSIPANLARDSRLPVILVLDGNLIFDLVQAIAHGRFTEAAGPLPPAIIVGVGYLAREGFSTYYARRNFDFHGPWEMTDPLGLQLKGLFTSLRNAEGSSGHATEILAGGYSAFLSLCGRPFTRLAAHYPISANGNHTLIGDSSGGHFALRALFDPKSPFSKYIAISPSLGTAPGEIEAAEAAFAATHSDLEADVFVCAGSAEVDESVPIALCRFGSAPIWAAEQFAIRQQALKLTWEIMNNENDRQLPSRGSATSLRAVHNLRPG
ncbi:MAG: hypothetical protein IPP45_14305 [Sphingomonadales bacterium]|nr:hypothetical protein [Sphingomonadales bacterium]